MTSSARKLWLTAGATALAVTTFILLDGYVNRSDHPRERLGRTPDEWRELRQAVGSVAMLFAFAACWLAALMLIHAAARRSALQARCSACDYPMAGLGDASVCPECGGVGRVTNHYPFTDARVAVPLLTYATGGVLTVLSVLSFASEQVSFAIGHVLLGLPLLIVAADRRLRTGEAALVVGLMTLAMGLGIAKAIWDATHSTDGQAAFGLYLAGCLGWMMVGPAYMLGAVIVYCNRRQTERR